MFEATCLTEYAWNKPVLCIFRERSTPETDPFVVIKARKVTVTQTDKSITGKILDFFRLMGDLDYLTSTEGVKDHYVACWFDDTIPDMTGDLRRLQGVVFNGNVSYTSNEKGKRTYNAAFIAKNGKLK